MEWCLCASPESKKTNRRKNGLRPLNWMCSIFSVCTEPSLCSLWSYTQRCFVTASTQRKNCISSWTDSLFLVRTFWFSTTEWQQEVQFRGLTLLISSLSSACIQMGLFSAADRQTGEVLSWSHIIYHRMFACLCQHAIRAEAQAAPSPWMTVKRKKEIIHVWQTQRCPDRMNNNSNS